LANKGWKKACSENEELKLGLNIVQGNVVYKAVSDLFGLPYLEVNTIL
jgi:alanine dehydrogenase